VDKVHHQARYPEKPGADQKNKQQNP